MPSHTVTVGTLINLLHRQGRAYQSPFLLSHGHWRAGQSGQFEDRGRFKLPQFNVSYVVGIDTVVKRHHSQ